VSSSLLTIRDIRKRFGAREVLRGVSLDVAGGEFLTVLGESGSGKTTLLRLIAGFEQADSGEIVMSGERIDVLPPYKRPVNTVFQQYALFPHMSVKENVAYGLRVTGLAPGEAMHRTEQALALVKMTEFSESSPGKLSGGQQQRVALARALVNRPKLLLLDEPSMGLAPKIVELILENIQKINAAGVTVLLVEQNAAMALAISHRGYVLETGRILLEDKSAALRENP